MYVCLCQGVTDGQIREAIMEGCCSYREVRETLGVASKCGNFKPSPTCKRLRLHWLIPQNILPPDLTDFKEPDPASGFFMPVIQALSPKMRNTNILIPIYFHLLFNNLGLTGVYRRLKLASYIRTSSTGPRS
jgi:hypothetical protein